MIKETTIAKPLKSRLKAIFILFALFPSASFAQETKKEYNLINPDQLETSKELEKSAQTIAKFLIKNELQKQLQIAQSEKIKQDQNLTNTEKKYHFSGQNENNDEDFTISQDEDKKGANILVKKDLNETESKTQKDEKTTENSTNKKVINKVKYLPRIDLNYKQGSNRNLGRSEALIPIWQDNKSMIFADIRGWIDSNKAKEGNLGIGYRKIFNDEFILGAYGFLDRKVTDSGNVFNQHTFGGEILTENLDLRANVYLPKESKKETNSTKENNLLQGSNVIVGTKSYEATHQGFDVEVGSKIPFFPALSLFYTYYHFWNKDQEIVNSDINGNKIRGELAVFSKKIHNLFLEGEYSNDNFRGANSFFGLRYSLNFSDQKNLSALEKRMTNPIYRDNDVVIEKLDGVLSKLKNSNGEDLKIIYVDANATSGGDGTFEKPYQTLTEAASKSSEYDLIYVYYNGGNVYDGNITLKDNQKLIGQGVDLTLQTILNDPTASSQVLISKVDYSKIESSSDYAITTGNNNLISGLDINSSVNQAIKADNKSNTNIIDNKINGSIAITSSTNSTNNIRNNIFSNNNISIESTGQNQTNNIENNTGIHQIDITSSYDSNQTNNISDNKIANNLQITSVNNSTQTSLVTDNTINNNVVLSAHNSSKQKYKFVTNSIAGTINTVQSGTATQNTY